MVLLGMEIKSETLEEMLSLPDCIKTYLLFKIITMNLFTGIFVNNAKYCILASKYNQFYTASIFFYAPSQVYG